MSFTIDSLDGYEKGKRYDKVLRFVRMFGNARQRSIILKDENGVELLWSTNDYTHTYQNFRIHWRYRFTVDHIMNTNIEMNIPRINIRNMKVMETLKDEDKNT